MKPVIRIDGEIVEPAGPADIVETEPGVWSVVSGGVVFEVRQTGDEITIAGHRFLFEIEDPRRWKRSARAADAQGRATIIAAMPGKIVRVLVAVGDDVAAGQGVLVIEAMKMQNEMKAPRDGRVAAIDVREHDSVNAGAKLLTIE
jgi:acetyl/propionyl-CoA carboxylase alpha subunit